MRNIFAVIGVATLLGAGLSGCTFGTTQQAELNDVLSAVCAGASQAVVLITADGQVLNANSSTLSKITTAGQFVQVNCSALPGAIAAIEAAAGGSLTPAASTTTTTTSTAAPTSPLPVLPSPTALVSAEHAWAPKIGIPQSTLDRIVRHYAR